MNLSLEHVGLAARNPGALRDWYARVLGATEFFCNGETPPAFLLSMPGGVTLEIYPADPTSPGLPDNKLAGWRHLALRVDSVAAARQVLAGQGVAFEEPIKPAGGGGRVLFFRDPEGNLLHLVERPKGWPAA
jgi:glyoxylase I family protein